MNRKIELLAPAGSYDAFIGAVNGGADAVYLAGDRFGARAYADNFTQEEIQKALFLAGLCGVKVYLTVNTLLKNKEMDELYEYISPLYEAGLDGVIIQDFGVLSYLHEQFPDLELHASTQMTVTSVEGAKYLKENHIKRVVLSRELTLDEIKDIIAQGIETECFIHGSMCYCYSGQCLFSSLIGGRSGNRGRCAQPCRLAYKMQGEKKESYLLSLKDMCTLEQLPSLLESGIASFKIEGRMKNPAYAAWVTHIYRKYIDRYLSNPSVPFKVETKDLKQLESLYIRTSIQNGYYGKLRGENMITTDNPAYSKTDDAFVAEITEKMIKKPIKKSVSAVAEFKVGQPCCMKVRTVVDKTVYEVQVAGDVVMEAIKAPLSADTIKEKLSKTGESFFHMDKLEVYTEDNVFLPVKALNELRRNALLQLEEQVKAAFGRPHQEKIRFPFATSSERKESEYVAFVEEEEQLGPIMDSPLIKRVVIPCLWFEKQMRETVLQQCKAGEKEIYLSFPAICRNDSYEQIRRAVDRAIEEKCCNGFYVNQVDSMAFGKRNYPELKCIGDLNLYNMNPYAIHWLNERMDGFTVSVELNKDELRHLPLQNGEMILYGHTPLMHTANCIFLTTDGCRKRSGQHTGIIKDRTNAGIPFRGHCDDRICYNTIYNSVATSLHKHKKELERLNCHVFQLRFTVETKEEVKKILSLYQDFADKGMIKEIDFAYTNGHFLRGVQ